jgi:peptide deformylase
MILPIVRYPDPVLRQRCTEVKTADSPLRKLADDMLDTMREAHGVGLAAPQIGRSVHLAVIDVSHDPKCVSFLRINGKDADLVANMPVVFLNARLDLGNAKATGEEGCLSFPGLRGDIRRSAEVRVTFEDLDGNTQVWETDGLLARAFQHEIDHLNGVLFIDRFSATAKVTLKSRLNRLMEQWREQEN